MKYKNIKGTELNPSVVCLGTGNYGGNNNDAHVFSLLDKYLDTGGNFLDTANIYGKWLAGKHNYSERVIGEWIKKKGNRSRLIIGTKGAHPHLESMDVPRMSEKEVSNDLDESLEALKTDYIDLYWLHRDDENTPVEYILDYLNKFVKQGKIRYFGCSNWKAFRISEAIDISKRKNIQGFSANQMCWSLAAPNPDLIHDRTVALMDNDSMRLHENTNLAAIPYSSQANGFFDKLDSVDSVQKKKAVESIYYTDENIKKLERIKQLANEISRSVTEIVLAWLLSKPFTTIPIIGSNSFEQMEISLNSSDLLLTENMVRFLEGK